VQASTSTLCQIFFSLFSHIVFLDRRTNIWALCLCSFCIDYVYVSLIAGHVKDFNGLIPVFLLIQFAKNDVVCGVFECEGPLCGLLVLESKSIKFQDDDPTCRAHHHHHDHTRPRHADMSTLEATRSNFPAGTARRKSPLTWQQRTWPHPRLLPATDSAALCSIVLYSVLHVLLASLVVCLAS
jgi:hypothetical protein